MGLTRMQFLKFGDIYKYMQVHGLCTKRYDQQVTNAKFSKQFFEIMDEDGEGVSMIELSYPLIALGLATDTGFVKKVMRMLAPKKFGDGDFENELTMKEFSTLFRSDPITEKMVAIIKA